MGDAAFVDAEEHQPTESQVGSFVSAIRREVDRVIQPVSVFVEDLGPEENPCGINHLPVDLPVIIMELLKESNTEGINEPTLGCLLLIRRAMTLSISIFTVMGIMDFKMLAYNL